ncbi:MAG TPA: type II toxin-antitoxin system HicB family antitoxin [Gemmatimonadaceae bacterium]|nr:type II toxin-antitoxin system HicB family antitoxin [Gemmatimonadaceae bacterium]
MFLEFGAITGASVAQRAVRSPDADTAVLLARVQRRVSDTAYPAGLRQVRAILTKDGLTTAEPPEGMSTYKYELIVYWSAEDAAFVVDVPELPGCMAHGTTPTEAVEHAQEAITLWPEVARKDGRPIPEPKGRRLLLA